MSVSYGGDSITFADGSVQSGGWTGFRNRIINGAMVIDQRNAGASFTPTDLSYSLDRWKCRRSQASKYTVQQNAGSVTPPSGFTNYLGVTSSSAYSVGTSDYFLVQQLIEGFNTADLDFGLPTAKTVTLSFWVRSSLTGTFGGALQNNAENRSYGFTYIINSANTWEQKTITIPGDTAGTWVTNSNTGLFVNFNLGTGSTYGSAPNGSWGTTSTSFTPTGTVSVVGTNAATWYITGVQLERSSTASSFEYRPYSTELQMCQRYYWQLSSSAVTEIFAQGYMYSTSQWEGLVSFPTPMRAQATITSSTVSLFSLRLSGNALTGLYGYNAGRNAPYVAVLIYSSNTTAGATYYAQSICSNSSAFTFIGFSAEL
jgi:hypothetical protein